MYNYTPIHSPLYLIKLLSFDHFLQRYSNKLTITPKIPYKVIFFAKISKKDVFTPE